MKRLIVILSLVVSGVGLAVPTRPASAQVECHDYTDFPTNWEILRGQAEADHVVGAFNYADGTVPTPPVDITAGVKLVFSTQQIVRSVTIAYLHWPGTTTEVIGRLYLGGDVSDVKTSISNELDYDWHTVTLNFEPVSHTDAIELGAVSPNLPPELWLSKTLAVKVINICSGNAATGTPYPSLTPSPFLTETPTSIFPSETPTPTNTSVGGPSPTSDTITPTSTSMGGPTLTPGPSATPGTVVSTGTATVTPTGTASIFGGNSFSTVAPPKACTDVYNPCGQLPFSVPPFATLNLPSPTALTQVALLSTATLVATTPGSVTGTPAGSTTPDGTTTGTPGSANAVISYATSIAGISQSISGTPGVNGEGGYTLDLANGANQVGQNMGDFVGVIRAVQPFFVGKTGVLIAFLLIVFIFIVFVQILLFVIPIVIKVFQFLLLIIGAIP